LVYLLVLFFSVVILLVIFNFLRKLQWDAIHKNLLDLADQIGGEVVRRNVLGRPIYHGKYRDQDITINFSTEKANKKRLNFIDISIGRNFKNSFTISALDWLEKRENSALEEFSAIDIKGRKRYGLRSTDNKNIIKKNMQARFNELLEQLDPFYFIFVGKSGLLFEKDGGNLALSTRHPALKNDLDALIGFSEAVN
jgi:hypothetical protein